jgi:hypothetical protein
LWARIQAGARRFKCEGISWHQPAQKFDLKCWQCRREQLTGRAIEAGLEADAKVALVHALHLGLFVRTPIK